MSSQNSDDENVQNFDKKSLESSARKKSVRFDQHITFFGHSDEESVDEDDDDIDPSIYEADDDSEEDENALTNSEDDTYVSADQDDFRKLEFDIQVRYQNKKYFQVIALIRGEDNLGFCYTFDEQNNRFLCLTCQSLNHSTFITMYAVGNEKTVFKIDKEHICEPIDFDYKQIIGEESFRIIDNELIVEDKEDDKFIKYRFLNGSNKYVCVECEASGGRTEAIIFHDKNDIRAAECDWPHVCEVVAQQGESGTVEGQTDSSNGLTGDVEIKQEPVEYDFDNGSFGGDMDPSESDELNRVEQFSPGCDSEDINNIGEAEQTEESQIMLSRENGDLDSASANESVASDGESVSENVEDEEKESEEGSEFNDEERSVQAESPYNLRKRLVVSYPSEDEEEEVGAKKAKKSKSKTQRSVAINRRKGTSAEDSTDTEEPSPIKKAQLKRPSKRIDAANFEIRKCVNGSIKLFIFPSDDHSMCYRYSLNSENSYCCSQCAHQNLKMYASVKYDQNGTEYIRMTDGHICELLPYFPSNVIDLRKNFEEWTNGHGRRELYIFGSDERTSFYLFVVNNKCYVCAECQKLKTFTPAIVKTDDNGEKYVSAECNHACQPQPYIPKIEAPHFLTRLSRFGKSQLIVFVDGRRDLCYKFNWRKGDRLFMCSRCDSKKKRVTASVFEHENGESFVQMYHEHICQPMAFNEREEDS